MNGCDQARWSASKFSLNPRGANRLCAQFNCFESSLNWKLWEISGESLEYVWLHYLIGEYVVREYLIASSIWLHPLSDCILLFLVIEIVVNKGKSQNGRFKKTKHEKFSEKRTFLTPWYAHVRYATLINEDELVGFHMDSVVSKITFQISSNFSNFSW